MKLRANEYCACIGFSDNKAIVGKRAAKLYKNYDVARFLSEGLYRQAFSLAYYHGDEAGMQQVLRELQQKISAQGGQLSGRLDPNGPSGPQSVADLIKLFGNIPAPQHLSGVLYV